MIFAAPLFPLMRALLSLHTLSFSLIRGAAELPIRGETVVNKCELRKSASTYIGEPPVSHK
jgi:hypothetical protein